MANSLNARPPISAGMDEYMQRGPEILRQFRTACQGGRPCSVQAILSFLRGVPTEQRGNLLVDLVAEHLELTWQAGCGTRLEAYIAEFGQEFPELGTAEDLPVELVDAEFVARYAFPHGDTPAIAEYRRRFPYRADILEQLEARCFAEDRYLLIQQQGIGGMGQVWRCYDRHLQRHVAIKLPLEQHTLNGRLRDRFADEARNTAGLEHPAIVSVHEYREVDGLPYYVMRWVQGDTLSAKIRTYYDRVVPGEQRALLWNRLLQSFIVACDAVAYAHSRGVLHRDLKPGNIVLGDFGETVVLDWGLGKRLKPEPELVPDFEAEEANRLVVDEGERATATELQTVHGQILGTISYMAPEQATGIVDSRSDVFSLGAILYEMLTGQPPYRPKDGDQSGNLLTLVREACFLPPRRLCRGVPRALEAICLKAMAPQPESRYPSAKDLADDMRRYLADERLGFCREPMSDPIRRWLRRHRTLATSSVAALVLALAFLGVITALVSRQNTALAAANDSERDAKEFAQKILEDMTSEKALAFLERQEELQPAQKAFLQNAVEYYRRFTAQTASAETERERQGKAFQRIGYLQDRLGARREAAEAYRQAIVVLENLSADFPAVPKYQRQLAANCTSCGGLHRSLGNHAAAEPLLVKAVNLLKQLVQSYPMVPDYRQELGRSYSSQVVQLWETCDYSGARALYEKLITLEKDLLADYPQVPEYRRDLANTYGDLGGYLLGEVGDPDVLAVHQEALSWRKQLVAEFPEVPEYRYELAASYGCVGSVYLDLKADLAASLAAYEQSRDHYQVVAAKYPSVLQYQKDLAGSYMNLGIIHRRMGNISASLEAHQKARAIYHQFNFDSDAFPRFRSEFARNCFHHGCACRESGDLSSARRLHEQALQYRKEHHDPNFPQSMIDLGASYGGQGDVAAAEGHPAEALAWYDQALQALQVAQATVPRRVRTAHYLEETYRSRALALNQLGRHREAIQDYDRAIKLVPEAKRGKLHRLRTQSVLQDGLRQQLAWPLLWGLPRQ